MIRFAIWAAVSTLEQAAPDKISLDAQIERCRAAALAKGWQETAGPFIAAGASRSFYVNLSDAEADIPALKELLDAAHANRYDVLVIYTYDRLGDLADMVAQSLRFDGKQLYSINQAIEPQPPDQYDPYNAEAEAIMRDASRITQRFRIDDLRRKWRVGIPARVRKGLTPLRIPYGYAWTGKKTPPRLDPVAASVLLRIRDEFMAGQSLRSICLRLAAEGIPSPSVRSNWDPSTLSYLLANSYYAGIVNFGKTICIRDLRRKNKYRQVRQPVSGWVSTPGLHEPLWDEPTHQAILAELQRRRTLNKRTTIRFPFSGLLTSPFVTGRFTADRMAAAPIASDEWYWSARPELLTSAWTMIPASTWSRVPWPPLSLPGPWNRSANLSNLPAPGMSTPWQS
jgi:DNA invertase Pin-like site-specific DNA recombinase